MIMRTMHGSKSSADMNGHSYVRLPVHCARSGMAAAWARWHTRLASFLTVAAMGSLAAMGITSAHTLPSPQTAGPILDSTDLEFNNVDPIDETSHDMVDNENCSGEDAQVLPTHNHLIRG